MSVVAAKKPVSPTPALSPKQPHLPNYSCSNCIYRVRSIDNYSCYRYPATTTNGANGFRPPAYSVCGEHPDFIRDYARYLEESEERRKIDEEQLRVNAELAAKADRELELERLNAQREITRKNGKKGGKK